MPPAAGRGPAVRRVSHRAPVLHLRGAGQVSGHPLRHRIQDYGENETAGIHGQGQPGNHFKTAGGPAGISEGGQGTKLLKN